MNKQQLLQQQVVNGGVMNAFCYPYARLLLDKVIWLKNKNCLFKDRITGEEGDVPRFFITESSRIVLVALINNLSLKNYDLHELGNINSLISAAEDFLAIFEE